MATPSGAGSYVTGLEQIDPAFAAIVRRARDETFKPSALDDKTKRLIGLALHVAGGSADLARGMALAAKECGATDQEISDVIKVCFMNAGAQRVTMGLAALKP